MSRASAVLVGVAGAGVVSGVVVVLVRAIRSERKRSVPELKLRLSAERAIASAGWRF